MNSHRTSTWLLALSIAALAILPTAARAITQEELDALHEKASSGSGIAQYNLGLVYANPQEPIANIVEAYVWLNLAADNGATGKALVLVSGKMTPEQISEATRLLEQRRADLAAHRPIPITAFVPKPTGPDPLLLQTELKKTGEALAAAAKENDNLRARLADADAKTAALDSLKKERDQLATTVEAYTNEISSLRAAAANFEGERNALKQQAATAASGKNSTAAELAAATAKLAAAATTAAELASAKTELANALARLAASDSGTKATAAELASAKTELSSALARLAAADTNANTRASDLAAARETLASLKTQVERLTAENQRLDALAKQTEAGAAEKYAAAQKALAELKDQLAQTHTALADSAAKAGTLETLKQERDQLAASVEKLTNEISTLRAASANFEGERNALTQKLADAASGRDTASAELAALRKQHAELTAQLQTISAAGDQSAKQAAATQQQLADLAGKLKATEEAESALIAERNTLAQQVANLQAEATKPNLVAEATITRLKSQLETAQQKANEERDTLAARLKTTEESLAAASAERATYAQQLASLKLTAQHDSEAQTAQLAQLKTQLAQVTAQLETSQRQTTDEKDNLTARLKKAELSLADANNEITALQQKIADAKPSKKEKALNAKLEELTAALETARAEATAHASKSLDATTQLTAAQTQLAELQAKLASAEASIATAQEGPNATIAENKKQIDELQLKLDASLRSYQLQQAEVDRLQKALASIDEERAGLAEKLKQANDDAAAAATKYAVNSEAATHLASLREQLRHTQNQLASVAYENSELKHRISFLGSGSDLTPAVNVPAPSAALGTPNRPGLSAPAQAPAAAEARTHTVASGETLSIIAKKYYGNGNRWTDILEANRDVIRNPSVLKVGTKLKIP